MKKKVLIVAIVSIALIAQTAFIFGMYIAPSEISDKEKHENMKNGLAVSLWPMYQWDTKHRGRSPYDTSGNSGQKLWNYSTGYWITSQPLIDFSGNIYFGSHDWYFYALNSDGSLKWKVAVGGKVYSTAAMDDNGIIYVPTYDSKKVYAIYASNGTVKWTFSLAEPNKYSSPAISGDGTIYVGCGGDNSNYGYMYAINPDGTQKWRYQAHYVVWSSPVIDDNGNIYFGSSSSNSYEGYVYSLNPSGTKRWEYQVSEDVISSPAIGPNGDIYIGSNDKRFYAFTPDGLKNWSYKAGTNGEPTGYFRYNAPAIGSDGTIYAGNSNGYIYAFYPNGTVKWMKDMGSTVYTPILDRYDILYVGLSSGDLVALNTTTQNIIWTYHTAGAIVGAPSIGNDGTVYVGSEDNNIYAIGAAVPEFSQVYMVPMFIIVVAALIWSRRYQKS